jgi:hypothetical protein
MFANAFLNPNQVSQDVTAWSNIKWTATLVATPTGDGRTRLAVGGASGPSLELLQFWVQADVLKVPGVEPMLKLRDT